MLTRRPSEQRGHFDHGWLDTYHSFSFADYRDPQHMGFRTLRVINEDTVAPGAGFPTHPHRDMEILTYVTHGTLAHRDSMGHEALLSAGEVQVMTAGSGITHSEYNASDREPVKLLQIWIRPREPGLTPRYDQRAYAEADKRAGWVTIASPEDGDEALTIAQDTRVLATLLPAQTSRSYSLAPDRHAWLQVVVGTIAVNGVALSAGDGLAISAEPEVLANTTYQEAEVLLFDLA